ncbi:piggyBac transposable element-derived protein 4-like [Mytilus edulis]|uniref:piggyBac transposable element-derived protein 4-like n=1 Tax=Mytilus edulis TaxID=6550 RepID=UPI0039EEE714
MDDSDESFSESDQSDLETEYDSDEGEEGEEGEEENDRNDEQVLQPWFRIFPPEEERRQPDFQETVGPQNMPNRNSKPIAYFYLLMTLNFLQQIVQETNRYARDFIASRERIRRFSRLHDWPKVGETTLTEIKGFFAVILNMGLVRKATIAEYWNCKLPSQDTSWFRKMFSRNRFQLVFKFFHLTNNNNIPGRNDPNYSPTAKFQCLIDLFNRQSQFHYKPEQNLSIDESLIGTRGRTCMLQYIPSKSSKFGVKVWMLVEAVTGYIIHAIIYRGKTYDPTPPGLTQGSYVVNNLLERAGLLRKKYHVVCDSFFTYIALAKQLFQLDTYFTGTIRQNRNMPNMIKHAILTERVFKYARQGPILMCVYRERARRKSVRILSSYEKATQNNDNKPKILEFYNKNMGGVDLADMMVTHYNDNRKTFKVWKKVAFNFLQRIVINAYILYCKNTSDRPVKSRLQFIQSIIEDLSCDYLLSREMNAQANPGRPKTTRLRKIGKYKDCSVCSDRDGFGGRHRTKTVCRNCYKGLHKDCMNNHVCIEE